MPPETNFDARRVNVEDVLFSTSLRLQVPRYQRPYTWADDQLSQFWEDIGGTHGPYFIGSFILNTEETASGGTADIIDGQQRLLTITILSAVVRDITKDIDASTAERFHRQDIEHEGLDGTFSPRIVPAESIAPYFLQHIQHKEGRPLDRDIPKTKEEKNVQRAYTFLYDKVQHELEAISSNESKLEFLANLRRRVRALLAIRIDVMREEDAYEVFESTNAKGMELSVADLLKNLILKKLVPEGWRDEPKEIWQDITTNVEDSGTELKRFLRYHWMSMHGYITEKQLYREVRNKVTDWQGFLQELWDSSSLYGKLIEADSADLPPVKKHVSRVADSLTALRLMGVSQCYVLFLVLLRSYDSLGTDPVGTFEAIENFTFHYSVVCKLPGNRIEKVYSKHAHKLQQVLSRGPSEKTTKDVQRILAGVVAELKELAPSKGLFTEAFDDFSYTNTADGRPLMKYVLGKFNAHFARTDEHKIDFDNVNVEHILPRNPCSAYGLNREEIKPYVNRIGNLTLLSQRLNSRAQNALVSNKIQEYRTSTLPITARLVEQLERDATWGREQIEARQRDLGLLAYTRIWVL